MTRVWLINARPEEFDGVDPVVRLSTGRYDLNQPNGLYYARLRDLVETANAYGCRPVLDVLELYSWSKSKGTLPGVPDRDRHFLRNNVQGVRFGEPTDDAWFVEEWSAPAVPFGGPLPGSWLRGFLKRVHDTLSGLAYTWEAAGNEFPEKRVNFDIADAIRALDSNADISVNRNEDTPGQIFNMDVGGPRYQRIALHGWKRLNDALDELHEDEAAAGRPTTFRKLLLDGWNGNPPLSEASRRRIVLSSDGARNGRWEWQNPYDWDPLFDVARFAMTKLGGYEHQSRCKMAYYTGERDWLNLDKYMEPDFLRRLSALQPVERRVAA